MTAMKKDKLARNVLIILSTVIAALLIIVILEVSGITNFFGWISGHRDTPTGPTDEQKATQAQVDQSTKKAYIESDKNNADNTEQAPIPTDPDVVGITTHREQTTSSNSLIIVTTLKGFASGTCNLSIKNGDKVYDTQVQIIYQPEYSTCAGFSVPLERLGVGSWSITLTATPTGGTALEKTITVDV